MVPKGQDKMSLKLSKLFIVTHDRMDFVFVSLQCVITWQSDPQGKRMTVTPTEHIFGMTHHVTCVTTTRLQHGECDPHTFSSRGHRS